MNTEFLTKKALTAHVVNATQYALDWRNWLRGLMGAIIGGVSSTIAVIVVDPVTFNFDTGFTKLCNIAVIAAILNAAQYLKLNPVPADVKQNEKAPDSNTGSV